MAGSPTALVGLRNRTMVLTIGGALFVLLIWFVAYFSPAGKQLASANTQTQAALVQQSQLDQQLARLRSYSKETSTLVQLSDRLSAALPPTVDIYDYITALSNAAVAAHVSIQNVSPTTPTSAGAVSVIQVNVTTTGTYDETLAFIKALYALPRLTIISSLQISGGGTSASRGTSLQGTFTLDIFSLPTAPTKTG
ncbi:MAG TPA: type 4a pilus biogenesis protein PilO [Acidimicrobiales bacterium]|nr:type 4a pilus biogenesis protein PilO [Acidimicrobiales bacterium]